MLTPRAVQDYAKSQPFRLHTVSGKTFDIRHPEMIKVLKTNLLIFSSVSDRFGLPDEWKSVSLRLSESASHLETQPA